VVTAVPDARWPPRRGGEKCVIGMVHLLPLPGGPLGRTPLPEVIAQAIADARALAEGGVDAVLVQNRGDRAFVADRAPPDVVAAIGVAVHAVVQAVALPVGVHVLRNDTAASIAVAHVAGARFVRAAVLTGVSPSAQGWLTGRPHDTLRYRRALGAEDVLLFADVASMHNQRSAAEAGEAASEAVFFGAADAVIVANRDETAAIALQRAVAARVDVPILVGGYATVENLPRLLEHADGAIVGEAFEREARQAGVDVARVRAVIARLRG
jgi:membrane complex biogenesis BtpA family protein